MTVLKVYDGEKLKAVYANVEGDENLDGTLRIWGRDEDGVWISTFKPGSWTRIEDISGE